MKRIWKGRILKMGFLSIAASLLLAGCGKEPATESSLEIGKELETESNPDIEDGDIIEYKGEPVNISEVSEITFGENGSMIPEISSFTLTRTGEETQVRLDIGYSDEYFLHMESGELMNRVQEILEENQVGEWNGFHGNNPWVLDGYGFHLYVTFVDGTHVSASGTNCFPPNFSTVSSALWELIQPTRKLWYDEQHPKEILDTHINSFSFRVYPKIGGAKLECSFERRSDDPGKQYLRAWITNGNDPKHPEYIGYFFYGVVPKTPYEELQEIVERYHLAEWNGYNEFLPSEQQEQTFYLSIGYESGESIEASGSLLPENYKEVEDELIRVLWDYIQENQEEFVPWE